MLALAAGSWTSMPEASIAMLAGAFAGAFLGPVWGRFQIVPHELGHALAAWAVGYPVQMIRLGGGRVLRFGEAFGVAWALGAEQGGRTMWARTGDVSRNKDLLVLAAGPIADGLLLTAMGALAAVGVLVLEVAEPSRPVAVALVGALWALAALMIWEFGVLVRNLVPQALSMGASDGLAMRELMRAPQTPELAATPEAMRAALTQRVACYGDVDLAEVWPDDDVVTFVETLRTAAEGATDGGFAAHRHVLEHCRMPDVVRAWLLDVLASWPIAHDRHDLLDDAKVWCAEGRAIAQNLQPFAVTEALLDVERGDLEQAAAVLEVWEPADELGWATAYLGYCEARAGRPRRADRFFKRAAASDSGLFVALRMRRRLSDAG